MLELKKTKQNKPPKQQKKFLKLNPHILMTVCQHIIQSGKNKRKKVDIDNPKLNAVFANNCSQVQSQILPGSNHFHQSCGHKESIRTHCYKMDGHIFNEIHNKCAQFEYTGNG